MIICLSGISYNVVLVILKSQVFLLSAKVSLASKKLDRMDVGGEE